MKHIITGTELFPYIHNAFDLILEEDGLVHPTRFTEAQMDAYKTAAEINGFDYYTRARASSNVTLEVITDADCIGLLFRWKPVINDTLDVDLLVDGVLYQTYHTDSATRKRMALPLPPGTHHVALVAPWSAELMIEALVLQNATLWDTVGNGLRAEVSTDREKKAMRILAFGDSITQGYRCTHSSCCYVSILTRALNAECLNQGVGGFVFDASVIEPTLGQYRPDLITVAYGTNDHGSRETAEEFYSGAKDFLFAVRDVFPHVPMLGILPIYRGDAEAFARSCIRDYSTEDIRQMLLELYGKDSNAAVLEDTYYPHHPDFFAPDYLHPNDLGSQIFGNAVVNKIRAWYKK